MNAIIESIGIYHPVQKVYNDFFEKRLETSDQWIRERTGIESRFFCSPDEYTSDMCVQAAKNLSETYHKDLSDVDFIIVATTTPDQVVPNVASQIQDRLNISQAGAIDLSSACAGFCNGLILAKGLIAAGTHRKILVFGADALSKVTDFADRTTCILFGDAAGVVLVERSEENTLLEPLTGTHGEFGKDLYLSSQKSFINGEAVVANNKLHQNGRVVYKWAIQTLSSGLKSLAEKNGLSLDKVDFFVPHSANYRMLEVVFQQLNIPMERCLDSVKRYGNTSAASIPLAWYEGIVSRKVRVDDTLLLMGFGGGFTYSGIGIKNKIKRV